MEDSVDRHIARWRGKAPFDDVTEAIVTRLQFLNKHLGRGRDRTLAKIGLQKFELETLHRLASRGQPWRAAPSELAAELVLSPAGMTGRLDTLEKAGLVRRIRDGDDRRRVDVELTPLGHDRWMAAMSQLGSAEEDLVAPLSAAERVVLAGLLKQLLLHAEKS